ncbi:unnamed protein product [Phyllotreta striolata]|uniref:Uncharacterized protein n=1 Tax=Phyllotreta striolata TaxID=444603 RepID=A0A9N9XQJ1_PHYSR|nr:unnamed protein product [Phyllotreta striolata]
MFTSSDCTIGINFFWISLFAVSLHLLTTHNISFSKIRIKSLNDSNLNYLICADGILEKNVEFRGKYVVLKNYIIAKRQFKCLESVTLSVPGDYRFLDNIVPLVERWRGPISVALYAPGYDFYSTLQSIAYLRHCFKTSSLVKEYVTFHIFFDSDHMPQMHDEPLLNIYQDEFDCVQKPPWETIKDEEMYKQRTQLFYPINVARNVAKLNAQTHFVFPSDIELYPTRHFISKFFNFTQRHPEYFRRESRNVFVFPLFEIEEGHDIPANKTELQEMLKNNTAFWFHHKVCRKCHAVPESDLWIEEKETVGLKIFTSAKRQHNQKIWEPFFLCTQKEPLWDERLNWEGQGNKMCQAYYLCMLDYNFLVFDNAFLIHKPGIKKKKVQNIKYKDELKKNNQILRDISTELSKIYGNNSNCLIHNVYHIKE